jgi:hypothetical protein
VADLRAPLPPPATDADRVIEPEATLAGPPTMPIVERVDTLHRPGQLSAGWRLIMVVAWVGVVLAWSAVWSASVQLGRPTWWLGTRADPTSHVIRLAPFAPPVVLILGALRNSRWLAWVGVAGALVFGGYAVADMWNEPDLAIIEIGIAAAGLLVSLLSLTGTYRRPSR